MKINSEDFYLLIESKESEKTAEFYRHLGFRVSKGYPIGDYLVHAHLGQIIINQIDNEKSVSRQCYKPFFNFDCEKVLFDVIIEKIRLLGSELDYLGGFYGLYVYEATDFSGGIVTLVCHVNNK